jgi:hypothetical protein
MAHLQDRPGPPGLALPRCYRHVGWQDWAVSITSAAGVNVHRRRWWILSVLCLSVLLVVDNKIVNVALPTMSRRLLASTQDLQWIVDAYTWSSRDCCWSAAISVTGSAGAVSSRPGCCCGTLPGARCLCQRARRGRRPGGPQVLRAGLAHVEHLAGVRAGELDGAVAVPVDQWAGVIGDAGRSRHRPPDRGPRRSRRIPPEPAISARGDEFSRPGRY